MTDQSWEQTEPLSQEHMRRLEEMKNRRLAGPWNDMVNPGTEEALELLSAWTEAEQEYGTLTELRRIRIGVNVIAAAMLVCALTGVLLALVLSAKPG